MSCVEDALYMNYLCKRCHYTCVETVNHFRLHPTLITDICKVPRTAHLLRFQVLVRNNGCRGGRFHWNVEFWHVEVVRHGWCSRHVEFRHDGDFEFWHIHLGSANVGMLGTSNFGIKNDGTLTLGMSNLGAASGTLNSETNDDTDAVGLGGGFAGTLNFGGEGMSILGTSSFGIKKDGMSVTLMSGTRKTTALGTTLTSLGWMRRGTTACQQCPILKLTLAPSLTLPIAAIAITRRRS